MNFLSHFFPRPVNFSSCLGKKRRKVSGIELKEPRVFILGIKIGLHDFPSQTCSFCLFRKVGRNSIIDLNFHSVESLQSSELSAINSAIVRFERYLSTLVVDCATMISLSYSESTISKFLQ